MKSNQEKISNQYRFKISKNAPKMKILTNITFILLTFFALGLAIQTNTYATTTATTSTTTNNTATTSISDMERAAYLNSLEDERTRQLENQLLLTLPLTTDNPNHVITFTDPSGKGVYLDIDGKGNNKINNPYTLPTLGIGKHTLIFEFHDKEQTEQVLNRELAVIPRAPLMKAPEVADSRLTVSGTGLSMAYVELYLTNGVKTFTSQAEVDDKGAWSIKFPTALEPGKYSIMGVTRKAGYTSKFSESISFIVEGSSENPQQIITDSDSKIKFSLTNFDFSKIGIIISENPDLLIIILSPLALGLILGVLLKGLLHGKDSKKTEHLLKSALQTNKNNFFITPDGKKTAIEDEINSKILESSISKPASHKTDKKHSKSAQITDLQSANGSAITLKDKLRMAGLVLDKDKKKDEKGPNLTTTNESTITNDIVETKENIEKEKITPDKSKEAEKTTKSEKHTDNTDAKIEIEIDDDPETKSEKSIEADKPTQTASEILTESAEMTVTETPEDTQPSELETNDKSEPEIQLPQFEEVAKPKKPSIFARLFGRKEEPSESLSSKLNPESTEAGLTNSDLSSDSEIELQTQHDKDKFADKGKSKTKGKNSNSKEVSETIEEETERNEKESSEDETVEEIPSFNIHANKKAKKNSDIATLTKEEFLKNYKQFDPDDEEGNEIEQEQTMVPKGFKPAPKPKSDDKKGRNIKITLTS